MPLPMRVMGADERHIVTQLNVGEHVWLDPPTGEVRNSNGTVILKLESAKSSSEVDELLDLMERLIERIPDCHGVVRDPGCPQCRLEIDVEAVFSRYGRSL